MHISLLTMGKTDRSWVGEALEIYASRLRHYSQFQLVELPELKGAASLSCSQVKEKEGQMLLSALHPGDEAVLLDEKGKEFRSVEFASMLQDRLTRSRGDLVFVVGGAYGFSDKMYQRADLILSLSKMTFSHQMVRVIFAEQLYRAFTILRGEPYHHE